MTSTKDLHFAKYNSDQGKHYANYRRDYHTSVYETVMNHHTATGGQLDTVLDVGCGPGLATRTLALSFQHAIGADPSEGMLATARERGLTTANSEPVRFIHAAAEDLSEVPSGSVDLITGSNAAHWIVMSGFWPEAARVLKPNGSVAFWTSGEIVPHPDLPNSEKIAKTMREHREEYLDPHTADGSRLVRNAYRDLEMPWDMDPPVTAFQKGSLFRKDWTPHETFHSGPQKVDLDTFEIMMGTGSAVQKWRSVYPDRVGTEEDVLRIVRRKIERHLHEAGVPTGQEEVWGMSQGVVLMVKKSS